MGPVNRRVRLPTDLCFGEFQCRLSHINLLVIDLRRSRIDQGRDQTIDLRRCSLHSFDGRYIGSAMSQNWHDFFGPTIGHVDDSLHAVAAVLEPAMWTPTPSPKAAHPFPWIEHRTKFCLGPPLAETDLFEWDVWWWWCAHDIHTRVSDHTRAHMQWFKSLLVQVPSVSRGEITPHQGEEKGWQARRPRHRFLRIREREGGRRKG